MDNNEVEAFLTDLAVAGHVAPSTQNQALHAILFLYRHVLELPIDEPIDVLRARERRRLPTVLSRDEVQEVLDQLSGVHHLIALLLYGSGLRVHECLALRVKDIDFQRNEIVVCAGKGDKDRVTMLPTRCVTQLNARLVTAKAQHDPDLARKCPNASCEWARQFVFPASSLSQHHLQPSRQWPSVTPGSA